MLAVLAIGFTTAVPLSVSAQSRQEQQHRQKSKNDWRNLGYLGGGVAIAGLLSKNSLLTLIGVGGGLYSAYRYEQDRKSQNKTDRARAELYSRPSFNANGYHYTRQTKWKNGKKYYTFKKSKNVPNGKAYGWHAKNG
jgi:hypothetical protein